MLESSSTSLRKPPDRPGVAVCEDIESLVRTGAGARFELVVWKRGVPDAMREAFDRLDFSGFHDIRIAGHSRSAESEFNRRLAETAWPKAISEAILADVRGILQAAEARSEKSLFTIRLEHVTGDACSKFHKDTTDYRIVTTYLGRGTQWAIAEGGKLGTIHELARFDIGLLLGERNRGRSSILHRSPPVGSSAEHRLLLVIDAERPAWRAKQGK